MLAKIYKCPFVELSAMLTANLDTLWREVLRKLHKYLQVMQIIWVWVFRSKLLVERLRSVRKGSDHFEGLIGKDLII